MNAEGLRREICKVRGLVISGKRADRCRVSDIHVEVLPERGVTFYAMPCEYHVGPDYRYAIVNDRPVIVEPRSPRIVEIIE
jgi:Protein of unknown function (DUF1236)